MEYRLSTRFRLDARGRPVPPEAEMAEAGRLYAAGKLREAAARCEAVIAAEPSHGEAHHLLGVISLDLGHPEAALAPLRKAVALNRSMARAHYHLGNALQALRRDAEPNRAIAPRSRWRPDFRTR